MTIATLPPPQTRYDAKADPGTVSGVDRSRRQQAIDAAAHVFARRGYHGAGTRAIADLLGIKVASLYFHFRSKEEALEEVCRVGLHEPVLYLRSAFETEPTFEGRIHRFFGDYSDHLARQSDYISVFLNERRYLSAEATARLNAGARLSASAFERLFADARAEGVMDASIPNRMARLVLIGVLNNITQLSLNGPIADFDRFVRHSGEHFVRGMAPKAPPRGR
ncbi:TetR family transcriptional regulator [Rhizobium sp. CRIBSB]|nr:TetR family transcriptional regulator [Rhizobium sp. CRIBSB]